MRLSFLALDKGKLCIVHDQTNLTTPAKASKLMLCTRQSALSMTAFHDEKTPQELAYCTALTVQ